MAWNLLFTSDMGLLSLFTLLFMFGMAGYIAYFVKRHIALEAATESSSKNRVDA